MEDQRHNSQLALEHLKNTDPALISRRGGLVTVAVRDVEAPKAATLNDTKFERVLAELLKNKPAQPEETTEKVTASTFASPESESNQADTADRANEKPAEHLLQGFETNYSVERQEQPTNTVYGGESLHELHEVDLRGSVEETVELRGFDRKTAQRPYAPVEVAAPQTTAEAQPLPWVAPFSLETSHDSTPPVEHLANHTFEQPSSISAGTERPKRMPKSERPIPTATLMERFRSSQNEKGFAARLEKLLPKRSEYYPNNADRTDQLHVPEEHRLQTSAWHSIEVDSKTGRPVENGTFQYGHEYYQERAHETTPRTNSRDAAAGEVALVAAAMPSADNHAGDSTQTPPLAASTTPARTTDHTISLKTKAADIAHKSMQASGPVWPFVVAFAAVVVLLILAFS